MTPGIGRTVRALRITARVWSVVVAVIVMLMVISPDPYAVHPIPAADYVLVFTAFILPAAGLLLAWRFELAGSVIVLSSFVLHSIEYVVFRGWWTPGVASIAVRLVLYGIPALLFFLCWYLPRRSWTEGQPGPGWPGSAL